MDLSNKVDLDFYDDEEGDTGGIERLLEAEESFVSATSKENDLSKMYVDIDKVRA